MLIGFTCEEGETEKRPGGMVGMDGGHFTGNGRVDGGGGAFPSNIVKLLETKSVKKCSVVNA